MAAKTYFQLQVKNMDQWVDTALISNDFAEIAKLAPEQGYSEFRIIQKTVETKKKKFKGCCG